MSDLQLLPTIGVEGWEVELRAATVQLGDAFWSDFTPVSMVEIDALERSIGRTLPDDYRRFLNVVGWGDFPQEFGGGFFSPDEVMMGCAGPLLMLLGSDGWASAEGQIAFYRSRLVLNPNDQFQDGITYHNGGCWT